MKRVLSLLQKADRQAVELIVNQEDTLKGTSKIFK